MSKRNARKYQKMFRTAEPCKTRPISWLVPDYIPLGQLTLFHGAGETCKSLMALHIASKISCGGRLEFDTDPRQPTDLQEVRDDNRSKNCGHGSR